MDYENMSDFEINKRVAENLNRSRDDGSEIENMFSISLLDAAGSGRFNPCNNPSDAWAVILENKISFQYEGGFGNSWESFHCNHLNECDIYMVGPVWNKNPLRAAMIVYLMMQEGK